MMTRVKAQEPALVDKILASPGSFDLEDPVVWAGLSFADLLTLMGTINDAALWDMYSALMQYESTPVSIDEFIHDKYFLNQRQLSGESYIWPRWQEELSKIFPNPHLSPYGEIVLTGAIGCGKSTAAGIGLAYELYKLLLMKNPQDSFQLMPTTKILFFMTNAILAQASDSTWSQFWSLISDSPFFMAKMEEADRLRYDTMFPHHIDFKLGTRARHALGEAIFSVLHEELNFQVVVKDQAFLNYAEARRRRESRFLGDGGVLPGLSWLVSSANNKGDFLNRIIEQAVNDDSIYVISMPLWEAKKHTMSFCGDTFRVFTGSDTRRPLLMTEAEIVKPEDKDKVIKVPVEYRKAFMFDVVGALRDLAGVPTRSQTRLFYDLELLSGVFCRGNLFHQDTCSLHMSIGTDSLLDFMDLRTYIETRWEPKRTRFVHLDMAYAKDRLGIAIGFMKGYREMTRIESIVSPKEIVVMLPDVVIEGVIAVEARHGEAIPLFKIREFLLKLKASGVKLFVTGDLAELFEDTRQTLSLSGIDTTYLSVDRTKEAYTTLRTLIYEGRLMGPKSDILFQECVALFDAGKKYDHPPDGSKDLSDAVAAVVFAITVAHADQQQYEGQAAKLKRFVAAYDSQEAQAMPTKGKATKRFRDFVKHARRID